MKYKKKPCSAMKVYKRKSGGQKFRMSGRKGGSGGGRYFSPVASKNIDIGNLVEKILTRIGFRVGDKKGG